MPAISITGGSWATTTTGPSLTSSSVTYTAGDLVAFSIVSQVGLLSFSDSGGHGWYGAVGAVGILYTFPSGSGSLTMTITQASSTYCMGIAGWRIQNCASVAQLNSGVMGSFPTVQTLYYTTAYNSAVLVATFQDLFTSGGGTTTSSTLSSVQTYSQFNGTSASGINAITGYVIGGGLAAGSAENCQFNATNVSVSPNVDWDAIELVPAPMVATTNPGKILDLAPRPTYTLNTAGSPVPTLLPALPPSPTGYLPPSAWTGTAGPGSAPVLAPPATGTPAPPTPVTANPVPATVVTLPPQSTATAALGAPTFGLGTSPPRASYQWWIQYRPLCYATTTSPKPVPTATWTAIPLDVKTVDHNNGLTLATGHFLLGLQLGYYWVDASVTFSSSTSGTVRRATCAGQFTTLSNPTTQWYGQQSNFASTTVPAGRRLIQATTATDYVTVQAYQDTGSSMNITAAFLYVEFAGN
jgi:hypothetical protein